ncbi:MAG: TonB-dependent receptor plug domain-containing protein [Polyangiaceae bacterium]
MSARTLSSCLLPRGSARSRFLSAIAVTLGLGALAASSTASAQTDDDDVEALLDEPIVETASKGSESATTAPATSTTITADQLRRYGIRSLDEALNYLSLGMTTSAPLHEVEVGARGVQLTVDYGNHVLLLVDGHRMNEPWNGTAYFERGAGIPLELIDRVEVVLGPGSVLYGSQAMLGVVHIVTKRAKDYAGVHLILEGGFSAPTDQDQGLRGFGSDGYFADGGGDYRVGAGYGREFKLFGQDAEAVLQVEYYRQSGQVFDFRDQDYGEDSVTGQPKNFGPRGRAGVWGGRAEDSYSTEVPSAYGRLYIGDWTVSARGAIYKRQIPYLDAVIQDTGNFDDPDNHETDRWINLDVSRRFALSVQSTMEAKLYADFYDYHWYNASEAPEDCPDGQPVGCDRLLVGRTRVIGAELQGTHDWDVARRNSTLAGIDAKLRHVDSFTWIQDHASPTLLTVGEFGEDNVAAAAYLQHTSRLVDPLTLNAGVRGDFDPRFGAAVSPRAALAYAPWQDATVKGIYSQAFRAPSAYERGYSDPNSDVANPDLEAETVRSLEASFEQRFGYHRIFFGAFRSWWSDMVVIDTLDQDEIDANIAAGKLTAGTPEAYQYRNLSRIDNWGLNAAYDGALLKNTLQYGFTLTSAYTRQESTGSDPILPTVGPQVFGNARVSYSLGEKLPTLATALQYQGRRLADQYYEGEFSKRPVVAPAWNLKATVSGDVPGVETLEYRVGANYSFAKYSPYTIGANVYGSDGPAELAPVSRLTLFAGVHYHFEP